MLRDRCVDSFEVTNFLLVSYCRKTSNYTVRLKDSLQVLFNVSGSTNDTTVEWRVLELEQGLQVFLLVPYSFQQESGLEVSEVLLSTNLTSFLLTQRRIVLSNLNSSETGPLHLVAGSTYAFGVF
jgi:hypothetical protein